MSLYRRDVLRMWFLAIKYAAAECFRHVSVCIGGDLALSLGGQKYFWDQISELGFLGKKFDLSPTNF